MSRRHLFALGAAALLAAVGVTPAPPQRAETLVSAVSRSLGGLRVFIVDIMFLRAEQARAQGDIVEAASLYESLLQMQPDNVPAAAHLVDIEFDNLGYVLDPDERFEGWRRLRRRVAALIELQPASGRLRYRDAQLILKVLRGKDTELRARVVEALREPQFVALMRTAEACMLGDTVRGLGSHHLDTFAFLALEVAADGLARGNEQVWRDAVVAGRAVLAERSEMLAEHRHPLVYDADPADPSQWILLSDLLALGLETIGRIAGATSREAAQAALDAFTARAGNELRSAVRMQAAVDAK